MLQEALPFTSEIKLFYISLLEQVTDPKGLKCNADYFPDLPN